MISRFGNSIVKNTEKRGKKRDSVYKAIYKDGKWFAKSGNKVFEIADADDLSEANELYSLPNNDRFEEWTIKTLDEPIRKEKKDVHLYWSKFKPGLIVTGKLKFHTNGE